MKIPKSESLIFIAFLGCVALWAVSKCSSRRSDIVRKVRDLDTDDLIEDRPVHHDTVVAVAPQQTAPTTDKTAVGKPIPAAPPPPPTQYTATLRQPGAKPERPPETTVKPSAKPVEPAAKSNTTLYVTIEGLKVRKEPGLKGETIEQLDLYAPVTFLNQKTEWKQEISLGYEKVTDHWVKIRTETGKIGWVFGAGVHFYKMKRGGVIKENTPAETSPKKKN